MNLEETKRAMLIETDGHPDWTRVFMAAVVSYGSRKVGKGGNLGTKRTLAMAEALVAAAWMWKAYVDADPKVASERRLSSKNTSDAFWGASARELYRDTWPKGFRESLRTAMHQAREYLMGGIVLENWPKTEKSGWVWAQLEEAYSCMLRDKSSYESQAKGMNSWFDHLHSGVKFSTADNGLRTFYSFQSTQPQREQLAGLAKQLGVAHMLVRLRSSALMPEGELVKMPVDSIKVLGGRVYERLLKYETAPVMEALRQVSLRTLKEGLGIETAVS